MEPNKQVSIAERSDSSRIECCGQVTPELSGARLDQAAASLFPDYSRERLKQWILDGSLTVNAAAVSRPRLAVHTGDELRLQATLVAPVRIAAEPIPLDVIYCDEHLAVINKRAGLTVHPGAGQPASTMQNALLHRFPSCAAVPRSGIIHRLDKDTSGLLVVALDLPAHTHLVQAMQAREIRREYDAVVHGALTGGGTVDAPVGRHPTRRTQMAVIQGGRHAVTHYRIVTRFSYHTHLRVRLETGRTHQIRVHMQHLRYPLIGDSSYGQRNVRGSGLSAELRRRILDFPRQALHARSLAFEHPVTGESLEFEVDMPADMRALIAALSRE